MSDTNRTDFYARLREIDQRHQRLASGYVRLEERDGLLVPVEGVKLRRGAPLRGIASMLVMFLLFKSFLLAYLGVATYSGRVASLESGNTVEQIGGWIMRADPVTHFLADMIAAFF